MQPASQVAKEDVGLFLLEEALTPSHSKTAVTIGKDDAAKAAV